MTIEIPTAQAPRARMPLRPPAPHITCHPRPLRILLVEDNKDTLGYLAAMLTKRGHDISTASNLASALRVARDIEVEFLISDIELPDGSGLELMRRLRSQRALPGIALSGFGSSDDIEQSHSAGFAVHLTKPVDFLLLEEAIGRLAERIPAVRLVDR